MNKKISSSILSGLALLISSCYLFEADYVDRSVQVLDKNGNPVPYSIIVKEESIPMKVFWIDPGESTNTDEIVITDKNGYYNFTKIPQYRKNRMTFEAFIPDGSYASWRVAETGFNLKGAEYGPFLKNTFDKKTNPNFVLYTDFKLLDSKNPHSRSMSIKDTIKKLRDDKFKKTNSKKEVDTLIEIFEKATKNKKFELI